MSSRLPANLVKERIYNRTLTPLGRTPPPAAGAIPVPFSRAYPQRPAEEFRDLLFETDEIKSRDPGLPHRHATDFIIVCDEDCAPANSFHFDALDVLGRDLGRTNDGVIKKDRKPYNLFIAATFQRGLKEHEIPAGSAEKPAVQPKHEPSMRATMGPADIFQFDEFRLWIEVEESWVVLVSPYPDPDFCSRWAEYALPYAVAAMLGFIVENKAKLEDPSEDHIRPGKDNGRQVDLRGINTVEKFLLLLEGDSAALGPQFGLQDRDKDGALDVALVFREFTIGWLGRPLTREDWEEQSSAAINILNKQHYRWYEYRWTIWEDHPLVKELNSKIPATKDKLGGKQLFAAPDDVDDSGMENNNPARHSKKKKPRRQQIERGEALRPRTKGGNRAGPSQTKTRKAKVGPSPLRM
ncbi:hypothetical protein DL93DRAFT_2169406 [Clavulina sp. PMI_390]|nr:hypothetical protein DL93DRAFT_2169406 [Clavulina sp. PMI_390]